MESPTDRPPLWPQVRSLDLELCRICSRAQRRACLAGLLRAASRLGDGPAWFALAVALPLLAGPEALSAVARLALLGVAATLVSTGLKRLFVRSRPYLAHDGIALGARPLDRFSFPSGHTLHAVAFTALAVAHYPVLAWILGPFTLLVAWSRVALGLHYPSDVLAGAAVGGALAWGARLLL